MNNHKRVKEKKHGRGFVSENKQITQRAAFIGASTEHLSAGHKCNYSEDFSVPEP